MILWVSVALAQSPPETGNATPPATPDPAPVVVVDDPIEVVVWGELAIARARDALGRQMEDLGYRAEVKPDGRIVFRPPRGWMGKATLLQEGDLVFGRPVVGLAAMPPEAYTVDLRSEDPTSLRAPVVEQGIGPTFWLMPAKSKVQAGRDKVLGETRDEMVALVDVIRTTAFEEHLLALPDRLDALWSAGSPLDPGPSLADPTARRRAVLEYWATRTTTPEGSRTCDAIEAWLSSVVSTSEHPVTAEERVEFDARRTDGHQLPDGPAVPSP